MRTQFYDSVYTTYENFDVAGFCAAVKPSMVEAALSKDTPSELDFLALLSSSAIPYLEHIANKAKALTKKRFGNAMILFTPLYISNYCDNRCVYCSFANQHTISRSHLSQEEIDLEARALAKSGIRHILLLTGESPQHVSINYLLESITTVRKHFSSVALEVYPLSLIDYERVCGAGTDAVTLYQEVYDKESYRKFHRGGPKEDFAFRLNAPDRVCSAGIHAMTVGALLGLSSFEREGFFTGLHAQYLQKEYPSVEISVAPPRIRPLSTSFKIPHPVSDRQFVQYLCALRIFLPTAGITVSTRESATFRNHIAHLGVTKMSAGVNTSVGGHVAEASTAQFEIADNRSVEEMKHDLNQLGFSPVMHDWNANLLA